MPRTFVHSAESGSCGGRANFCISALMPTISTATCPNLGRTLKPVRQLRLDVAAASHSARLGGFGFALSHRRRSGRIQVYLSLLRERIRILHTPRWFGFGNLLCANCIQVTNSLEVERLMEQLKAGLLTPSGSGFCRWRQLGHPWKELMTGAMYYLIVRRSDCRTDHPM